MNYERCYSLLIERARNRITEKPFDKHHIIPRSIGGDDSKTNIAALTIREHIFAHVLLAKLHPENFGLVSCAFRMLHGSRSSKRASWLRKKFVDGISGDNNPLRDPDVARAVSEKLRGKCRSEETKKRVSDGLKRYFSENKKRSFKHTEETKKRLSELKSGKPNLAMVGNENWLGKKHKEESKEKIRLAITGITRSEETKRKISEAKKGKKLSEETKEKMRIARNKYLSFALGCR
jgi:hypothetical protein